MVWMDVKEFVKEKERFRGVKDNPDMYVEKRTTKTGKSYLYLQNKKTKRVGLIFDAEDVDLFKKIKDFKTERDTNIVSIVDVDVGVEEEGNKLPKLDYSLQGEVITVVYGEEFIYVPKQSISFMKIKKISEKVREIYIKTITNDIIRVKGEVDRYAK